MTPLYTKEEFDCAKSSDQLPCECEHCKRVFHARKNHISYELKTQRGRLRFCTTSCNSLHQSAIGSFSYACKQCGNLITRKRSEVNRSGTGLFFCSRSCAAIYRNAHKTTCTRRSKLEEIIETAIRKMYPAIDCLFNDKTAIESELDIFIPSLLLGIEINGILHYRPVFGSDRLGKIQHNDRNKINQCEVSGISLHVIDASRQKYVNQETSQVYVNSVLQIIENRISNFSLTV